MSFSGQRWMRSQTMRVARYLTLAVLVIGIDAGSAQASLITLNYDVSASGFPAGFPAGAPVDPVTFTLSLIFDNASDLSNVTTGISVTNANIAILFGVGFSYFSVNDSLVVGGRSDGVNVLAAGTNDLLFTILNASTNPTIGFFAYSQVSQTAQSYIFTARSSTLSPSVAAPVPEAATFSLLALGLAGLATRLRQRKAA